MVFRCVLLGILFVVILFIFDILLPKLKGKEKKTRSIQKKNGRIRD